MENKLVFHNLIYSGGYTVYIQGWSLMVLRPCPHA